MRAFLVLGPESTGTRLWTKILISAGCHGSAGHGQPWDSQIPTMDPIVWRRSFPHNHEWPDLPEMCGWLEGLGYDDIQAVVTTRDWHAVVQSQLAAPHVAKVAEAFANLQYAYPLLFYGLTQANVPYIVVGYEPLVQRGMEYAAMMARVLGLGEPSGVDVHDGNAKWYGEA